MNTERTEHMLASEILWLRICISLGQLANDLNVEARITRQCGTGWEHSTRTPVTRYGAHE